MAPLAQDMSLPAFPSLAEYFDTDIRTIQFTLVTVLAGSTVGQFLGGPVSDALGRMRVGLIGCLLFALCSFGIAVTDNFTLLLWLRFAQGFAAGAAGVVVSAIISENYHGKDSARAMLAVTMVMMGVPLVAPMIGTLLLKLSDWHTIFYFYGFYGILIGLIVHLNTPPQRLRPSSPERRNLFTGVKRMFANYRTILSKPLGRVYLMGMGLNVCVYVMFATTASFIYMEYLGAPLEIFPLLIGANTASLLIGNRAGAYLLRKIEPARVCTLGSRALAASCLSLAIAVIFFEINLPAMVAFILLISASIPMSGPVASSIFMELYDANAGTASASMGVARVAISMLGGFVVTILHNGTLYPTAFCMLAAAVGAMLCFRLGEKRLAAAQ